MTKMSMAEVWDSYRAEVIDPRAGPAQITETRRAFYSGAWAMLLMFERVGEPDYSQAQAYHAIDRVKDELLRFKDQVGEGDF